MSLISVQDVKRKGMSVVDAALKDGPVQLVRSNRAEYVVLSTKDYQELIDDLSEARLEASMRDLQAGRVRRGTAAKLMAENPARHFRIDHVKGALTVGRDADIVVMTPEPYVCDAAASGNTVVSWSPYNGMRLPWRVAATYNRGDEIYAGGKVLAEPGRGRFVRPPVTRPISP